MEINIITSNSVYRLFISSFFPLPFDYSIDSFKVFFFPLFSNGNFLRNNNFHASSFHQHEKKIKNEDEIFLMNLLFHFRLPFQQNHSSFIDAGKIMSMIRRNKGWGKVMFGLFYFLFKI